MKELFNNSSVKLITKLSHANYKSYQLKRMVTNLQGLLP